jgi:hypothetical protein
MMNNGGGLPNQPYNQSYTSSSLGNYQPTGSGMVPGVPNSNGMFNNYGSGNPSGGFGYQQPSTAGTMGTGNPSAYSNMGGMPNLQGSFFPQNPPGASNMNVMNMLQGLTNAMQAAGSGQGMPGTAPGFGGPSSTYPASSFPPTGYPTNPSGYNPSNFYNPN